jgi:hypothetical protein
LPLLLLLILGLFWLSAAGYWRLLGQNCDARLAGCWPARPSKHRPTNVVVIRRRRLARRPRLSQPLEHSRRPLAPLFLPASVFPSPLFAVYLPVCVHKCSFFSSLSFLLLFLPDIYRCRRQVDIEPLVVVVSLLLLLQGYMLHY